MWAMWPDHLGATAVAKVGVGGRRLLHASRTPPYLIETSRQALCVCFLRNIDTGPVEIHVPVAKTWRNTLVIQAFPPFQLVSNCCQPGFVLFKAFPRETGGFKFCVVHFELAQKLR